MLIYNIQKQKVKDDVRKSNDDLYFKLFISGVVLTILSWIFAWGRFASLYEYTFFPLWLGLIITINGFSGLLLHDSLLSRMNSNFLFLFLVSIPFWWFFELLNLHTQNWRYIGPELFKPTEYFLRASISFSTVVPAILSVSFLVYGILRRIRPITGKKIKINPFFLFTLGIIALLLIFFVPNLSYPLVWVTLFLLVDPLNYSLGLPSFLNLIRQGKWTIPISVAAASLFTGFWWELWNFYSLPKWTYSVPYLGFFKIFEMPILGYIGYLTFGLEVYSFTSLSFGILKKLFGIRLNNELYNLEHEV
ncbi:MAG: hypothetical protein HYU80_04290 [Candidatus Blackburnbacteria bacterium]|nr:hypothetical protein [Candidatus Blackburnbacteria bacterium]